MAAEITRQDLIDDDALMAPLVLSKNLEEAVKSLNKVLATGKQVKTTMSGNVDSFTKLGEEQKKMNKTQDDYAKIQAQIQAVVRKTNDEYIEQTKVLANAKEQLKQKTALGDLEAKSLTKQTASITQLGAALNANRKAYSSLRTEEERSSKAGKDLLKVIQQQDKEFKELRVSMGQAQDNVGNYHDSMAALDATTGGLISQFKMLGQQLLKIFSNPWIAAAAAVVAIFLALKDAVQTYYDTSAEGEEQMKKQSAAWDAFFITLKRGWAEVGKSVSDFFGDDGLKGFFQVFLAMYAPSLLGVFIKTDIAAEKLADKMAKLWKDHTRDVVDDADTEVKANNLLEISRDKMTKSAEQRLTALQAHNKLRREQLEGDIQLAKDDVAAQELQIQKLGGYVKAGRLVSQMTDDEIRQIGVKQEEVEKLGQLQSKVLQTEAEGTAKRISLLKLEKALTDEIHKDKIDQLNKEVEEKVAAEQMKVDIAVKAVEDEVIKGNKLKVDGDKEIAAIRLKTADEVIDAQIKGLEKVLLSEELNADERAEVEKRLVKLRLDLTKAFYDQVETLGEVKIVPRINQVIKDLNSIEEVYVDFSSSINDLFASITDTRLQGIEAESEALEKQTDERIKLAGDNDEAVKKIENEAEVRRQALSNKIKEEKTRNAKVEKASSLIKAGIQTAQAVLAALAGGPPPFNLALATITATAAAIQTAAIAASPIPKFAEGTGVSGHKGGAAIFGERGFELVSEPGKTPYLSPNIATLTNLPAGTKILSHEDTVQALAAQSIIHGNTHDIEGERSDGLLVQKIDQLNSTIKNKKELHINFTKKGVEALFSKGASRDKFMNDFYA